MTHIVKTFQCQLFEADSNKLIGAWQIKSIVASPIYNKISTTILAHNLQKDFLYRAKVTTLDDNDTIVTASYYVYDDEVKFQGMTKENVKNPPKKESLFSRMLARVRPYKGEKE